MQPILPVWITSSYKVDSHSDFHFWADSECPELDLATEFDEAEHFDNIAAGKIRRILSEYEIYPRNISVIEDK